MLFSRDYLIESIILRTDSNVRKYVHYSLVYVMAEQFDNTRGFGKRCCDDIKGCRLACPIGSEQPKNLSFVNGETIVSDRHISITIFLIEMIDDDIFISSDIFLLYS